MSFDRAEAEVFYDTPQPPLEELARALARAGFKGGWATSEETRRRTAPEPD